MTRRETAMATDKPPLPPHSYATWLDFAVETFDTRGEWVTQVFSDNEGADREAMRDAARSELRDLRAKAAGA